MSLRIRFADWRWHMFMAAFLMGTAPMCAFAQQIHGVPKAFEQKVQFSGGMSSMADMLASLSKQSHINILVDGIPLLPTADIKLDGTVQDALDKVADTFDYTWTLNKSGVVLMSKRFRNPNERPQVYLAEMIEMTRDMLKALTLVDYDKNETHSRDLIKQAAKEFTPEQIKSLDSGEKLHGSDLTTAQKDTLRTAIIANTFLASLNLWQSLAPNLENIQISRIQTSVRCTRASDPPDAPTHDYHYMYRSEDGKLHVFDLPHIVYGHNQERLVTP